MDTPDSVFRHFLSDDMFDSNSMWRPSYERLSLWRTRFMFILLHPDTKLTVSNYMQAVTVADFHTE